MFHPLQRQSAAFYHNAISSRGLTRRFLVRLPAYDISRISTSNYSTRHVNGIMLDLRLEGPFCSREISTTVCTMMVGVFKVNLTL
jgi:hypothetical protein